MDTPQRHLRTWGLTGGIGAGKSLAAAILRRLGFPVLDMDALAKSLMAPGTSVNAAIAAEFGSTVVQPDGHVNRAALAFIVFGDPARRRALEQIVHPPTIVESFRRIDSPPLLDVPMVFVESAILFDVGLDLMVAGTVVVTAPEEVRIARVMARDNLARPEVEKRLAAQMEEERRCGMADVVWDNSGNLDGLRRQIVLTLADGETGKGKSTNR